MSKAEQLIDRIVESVSEATYMKDDRGITYEIPDKEAERILIKAGIPFAQRKMYKAHDFGSPQLPSPNASALRKLGKRVTPKLPGGKFVDPFEKRRKAQIKAEAKFVKLVKKEAKNWKGWAKGEGKGLVPRGSEPEDLASDAAQDAARDWVQYDREAKKAWETAGHSLMIATEIAADYIYDAMMK